MESPSILYRSYEFPARLNRLFFQNLYIPVGPVAVLVTGLIIRALLPSSLFDRLRASPLFSESSILNNLFANHGFFLFTALYLLISFVRIMTQLTLSQPQSLLPSMAQTRNRSTSRSLQMGYLLIDILSKYLITLCVLILLMDVRDIVVRKNDAFNISGHFMAITTITVSLLVEVRVSLSNFELWDLEDRGEWSPKTIAVFWCMASILGLTAVFVVIWWCVLLVTAVFYHTVKEKLIGLALGYVSPLAVYCIKPLAVQYFYQYINN